MEMSEFSITELFRLIESENISDGFKSICIDEAKKRGVRFPLLDNAEGR